jgi:hypothetical protein
MLPDPDSSALCYGSCSALLGGGRTLTVAFYELDEAVAKERLPLAPKMQRAGV